MKSTFYFVLISMFLLNIPQTICQQEVNILAASISAFQYTATDTIPDGAYESPQKYEIGGIKILGAKNSDDQSLITLSGLAVGDVIEIPGTALSSAIKKLWALKLFSDIKIVQTKNVGEITFLEIIVQEKPRYTKHNFKGAKKSRHEDLNSIIRRHIDKGAILTPNIRNNITNGIKNFYAEKGYLDASVEIETNEDKVIKNGLIMTISIDVGNRVKVEDITFSGNSAIKSKKLRKAMKETSVKRKIFSKSKFEEDLYEQDKNAIIAKYQTLGYKDARIASDTLWRTSSGDVRIHVNIDEGRQYYFRNISWKGNNIYSDEVLTRLLGIAKGDIYNTELLAQRISFSLDGRDVSSLYMDDGYLFFRVDPVELAIENDSIDLEMRIFEGPQATIDKVIITGNDRTNEHVIRRELRTRPGSKFSRSDIVRSQRQLVNLGYFDQEQMSVNTPVNQERYTVDIEYGLVEKSSDQLELSAGYGGYQGLIGTLGVVFNNFSLNNIFNKSAWRPLPTGDGQRLSIRAQSNGRIYQSYNASFTEPWLGGTKPTSLTVGGYYTRLSRNYFADTDQYYSNSRFFIGLGKRVKWPDDNFIINAQVNIENYFVKDYPVIRVNNQTIQDGSFNNHALELTLTRTSINEPIFPTSGSTISVKGKFTPPYSLISPKENYDELSIQDKFRFLEYHKWRVDLDWYTSLVGKLVFRANGKVGILGYYNKDVGLIPFERFEVGGAGLNNQAFGQIGKEIISTRGYETSDFATNLGDGSGELGSLGSVFNKFTLELRYPVSLNPSATIYVLGFVQGTNTWLGLDNFNPFDLRRSAGLGLRAYLPMFGLIGFDYGVGFDKPNVQGGGLKNYGTFNLVLGFEPD